MSTTSMPGTPPASTAGPVAVADATTVAELERIRDRLAQLARLDWAGAPGQVILAGLRAVEQVSRPLAAVRARATAAAAVDGSWSLDGSRSLPVWLEAHTHVSRPAASAQVKTGRALVMHLPLALEALAAGEVGTGHAGVFAREILRTDLTRAALADDEKGEPFLVQSAKSMDAGRFTVVAKKWAAAADPDAADRAWRQDGQKEELFISETTGGFHIHGWADHTTGRTLLAGCEAHMGRKSEADTRTPSQRRMGALAMIVHESLSSGRSQPSARIPRQVLLHVPYPTLEALINATNPGRPRDDGCMPDGTHRSDGAAFGVPPLDNSAWAGAWEPGSDGDHVISTTLERGALRGYDPATFTDGTPIPPALLAQLACGSQLTRIVFGPAGTVLDVGRAQRIFPANQTKAIIARDQHCRFPGCHEAPEFGEIHHSLWWAKHHGPTAVGHGILLCWAHHAYVHRREITIARVNHAWVFYRNGTPIHPPGPTGGDGGDTG